VHNEEEEKHWGQIEGWEWSQGKRQALIAWSRAEQAMYMLIERMRRVLSKEAIIEGSVPFDQ
jgi:hypothetical protein